MEDMDQKTDLKDTITFLADKKGIYPDETIKKWKKKI